MKRLKIPLIALLLLSLSFSACDKKEKDVPMVDGYQPVYMDYESMRNVFATNARDIETPGKIYYKDNFVYINEVNQGIHIMDNSDPTNPINLAFISIPGNKDISIKGQTLYADNTVDLVALDISDLNKITVTKRLSSVFPQQAYPRESGVTFECIDPAKGVVVDWKKTKLEDPKCYR